MWRKYVLDEKQKEKKERIQRLKSLLEDRSIAEALLREEEVQKEYDVYGHTQKKK